METLQNHRTRLAEIVEMAYRIVCQKVAEKSIEIYNEASLQLHLGTILKSLGQLYEFSPEERFVIELEKRIDGIKGTSKTEGAARCDIVLSFYTKGIPSSQAFLELKYFKISDNPHSAEASKDNRFALFMDLENLEHYRKTTQTEVEDILCYEIAIAQNKTYADPASRSNLKTGHGKMTNDSKDATGKVMYASRKPVSLEGNYLFDWSTYSETVHGLIIRMQ